MITRLTYLFFLKLWKLSLWTGSESVISIAYQWHMATFGKELRRQEELRAGDRARDMAGKYVIIHGVKTAGTGTPAETFGSE
jgi:hypothetical protein